MKKKTCILHYGAGVVAALAALPIAVLIIFLFTTLEVWDAINGNPSWWDFQEFVLAYIGTNAAVILYALIFAGGLP